MKHSTRIVLGLLSAMALLSLLLVAPAVQATPASSQSHDPRQRDGLDVQQPVARNSTSTVAQDPRQRDGFDVEQTVAGMPTSTVTNGTQPAGQSAATWIIAGSMAAALIIALAAWALLRRRQPGDRSAATYCAQHFEDPVCGAV
jgi:hypothetical protein